MPPDQREFTEQILAHPGIIDKVVTLYFDTSADRADARQEILLQAWSAFPRFRGEAAFATWLYRIALNTSLTLRRRHRNRPTLQPLDQRSDRAVSADRDERVQLLWNGIRRLNDIDRAIVTLHLDGYSHKEIGEVLGLRPNNVGVRLHRCKTRLAEQLQLTTS